MPRASPRNDEARRMAFINFYLADPSNASAAALKAGYSPKGVSVTASRLLDQPYVQQQIAAARARQAKRIEITLDNVIDELGKIAFANMNNYMKANSEGDPYLDFRDLTDEQAAALQEVTVTDFRDGKGEDVRQGKSVKFKLSDKRAALVDLGRHLGGFINRTTLGGGPNGTDPIPIEVKHTVTIVRPEKK